MPEEVKNLGLDELDRVLRLMVGDRAAVIIRKIEEKKPSASSRTIDIDADWLILTMLEQGIGRADIVRFLKEGLQLDDESIQVVMHRALSRRGDKDPVLRLHDSGGGAGISAVSHDALKKLGDEYE